MISRDKAILVTGAKGMVGSHLCRLLSRSHEVLGIDVMPGELKACNYLQKSIREIDGKFLLENNIGAIVHLGAYSNAAKCLEAPTSEVIDINILQATRLFELCDEAGIDHFVHASTEWVYGDNYTSERTITPDQITSKGLDLYSESKLISESMLMHVQAQRSSEILTILRLGIVYGSSLSASVVDKIYRMALEGERFSPHYPGNARRFIHIDDVLSGIQYVLSNGTVGIFDIQGPELYTIADVCNIFNPSDNCSPVLRNSVRDCVCTLPKGALSGMKIENAVLGINPECL
jgi:nucleoside-diphosphate-sugar epimerase